MGIVRDFRKATLDYMRENLVDQDPTWDGFVDWIWGWDVFDIDLAEDLSNFDEYMERLLEINDITRSKLNSIVADVHGIENVYAAFFGAHAEEMNVRKKMFNEMYHALNDPNFETDFDAAAFKGKLGAMLSEPKGINLSYLSLDALKILIATLPLEKLLLIDVSALSPEGRKLYYQNLYKLLADPNLSEQDRQAILDKLAQMSHEDAMALVFDEENAGKYGGDQGDIDYQNPELRAIVKQYFPDMIEDEISQFLKDIPSSGCSYISAINSIFVQYANNPEGFEKAFGFPMFIIIDGKPVYNFRRLYVELYCYGYDEIQGDGMLAASFAAIVTSFLQERDPKLTIQIDTGYIPLYTDSAAMIQNELNKGNVVLLYISPSVMYDMDGNPTCEWETEEANAHDVIVTGIAPNGDLIVSSWGRQYTVRLSECEMYRKQRWTVEEDGETVTYNGGINIQVIRYD